MAGSSSSSDDEITGINVTPLVDVMLVLLVIFMVTAKFIVHPSVKVDLPKAAHAGESVKGLVNVALDAGGTLYFDGKAVSEAALETKVKAALAKDPNSRAIITADRALPYGRVIHVIDLIKGEGIAKFALNIQKDVSPQPKP